MPVNAPRAIIFDIGRVLVRLDIGRVKSSLAAGLPLSPEELWAAIEKDPHWQDWQEGRLSAYDWYLNLTKRFKLALDFEQFKSIWNLALDPEPIHPTSLFKRLSKKHRLGLLSNTDPIHVAHLEATYDFFAYFAPARRIYSCVIGASKPNPVIYQGALKACKVKAEEALYIDDIEGNVEAARRLGLRGIHFRSAGQLREELEGVGVELERPATT